MIAQHLRDRAGVEGIRQRIMSRSLALPLKGAFQLRFSPAALRDLIVRRRERRSSFLNQIFQFVVGSLKLCTL